MSTKTLVLARDSESSQTWHRRERNRLIRIVLARPNEDENDGLENCSPFEALVCCFDSQVAGETVTFSASDMKIAENVIMFDPEMRRLYAGHVLIRSMLSAAGGAALEIAA